MAGTKDVKLTAGEQARYVNSVTRSLGGTDTFALQRYMKKDSAKNAAYSIFYVGSNLTSRKRQDIFNTTGLKADDVEGVSKGALIKSIRVTPNTHEVPLWVDDRSFDKSQLSEESEIVAMQTTAIYTGAEKELSVLFKDIYTNKKRTVKDTNNADVEITVPEKNFFGDEAKPFTDPTNIKAFRRMLRVAKTLAKNGKREIAIIAGDEGHTELCDCDKFTSKDWMNFGGATPNETGDTPAKLLGGYTEELVTYDETFYSEGTETTGVITVILSDTLGQSNKNLSISPTIDHVSHKKAYFMDVEIDTATELLQGEGIFFFKYKK